jgi:hypothetical protein
MCNVLRELGDNLKKDERRGLCSQNAVVTAEKVVKDCVRVFVELEGHWIGRGLRKIAEKGCSGGWGGV